MAILAGLSAKNNSTRFQQESQGHDKDLLAPQRQSSRSFWRDLGMLHSLIWLDWTCISYLGLSVKQKLMMTLVYCLGEAE